MEEGGSRRKGNQKEARQRRRKASRAGSPLLGKTLGNTLGQFPPYRGIDGEGPLPVAGRDVKGEEGIAPAVSVAGQDVGDEAGDGAVLTDGHVHGEVQQHRVVVIDVQHPNPHQHLGRVRGGGEEEEGTDRRRGGVRREREKEGWWTW